MSDPVAAFSAEELEALGREHEQAWMPIQHLCQGCMHTWPCSTARLLATVAEMQKRETPGCEDCDESCACWSDAGWQRGEPDRHDWWICGRCHTQKISSLKSMVEANDAEIAEYEARMSEVVAPFKTVDGLEWCEKVGEGEHVAEIPVLRGSPKLDAFFAKLHDEAAEQHALAAATQRNLAGIAKHNRELNSVIESLREQLRQQTERADTLHYSADMQFQLGYEHGQRERAEESAANLRLYVALQTENAALKAQVAETQAFDAQILAGQFKDPVLLNIEAASLRATIEAQKAEHQKVSDWWRNESQALAKKLNEQIEARGQEIKEYEKCFGEQNQRLSNALESLATKDAILRECAKTFRKYERVHREGVVCAVYLNINSGWCGTCGRIGDAHASDIECQQKAEANAALTAKCEAVIGEKL